MIPPMPARGRAGGYGTISPTMPSDLELVPTAISRRQMSTPFLLFLASHRPLTFVTGQLLYVVAPCVAILGWEEVTEWAALLSAPDASQQLTTMLTKIEFTQTG